MTYAITVYLYISTFIYMSQFLKPHHKTVKIYCLIAGGFCLVAAAWASINLWGR